MFDGTHSVSLFILYRLQEQRCFEISRDEASTAIRAKWLVQNGNSVLRFVSRSARAPVHRLDEACE